MAFGWRCQAMRFAVWPVLSLLVLTGCDEPAPQQPQAASPPAVFVARVERQSIAPSAEFIGRVEAIDRLDVRARITGFL